MAHRIRSHHVDEVLDRFRLFLERRGSSTGTIKNRCGDVQQIMGWSEEVTGEPFKVRDFAAHEVQRYQKWLAARFQESTVNRRLSSLRLFLAWAADEKLIQNRANIRVERRQKRAVDSYESRPIPRLLTPAEMRRLYDAADAADDLQASVVLRLIGENGLRVSELCALKWRDVKVISDHAIISFGQCALLKSGDIPLRDECRQALTKLWESTKPSRADAVFHGKSGSTTRRVLEMMIDRYSKALGLRDVTSKTLRLSFITNLLGSVIDSSEIAMLAGRWITNLTRAREILPYRDIERSFAKASSPCPTAPVRKSQKRRVRSSEPRR